MMGPVPLRVFLAANSLPAQLVEVLQLTLLRIITTVYYGNYSVLSLQCIMVTTVYYHYSVLWSLPFMSGTISIG